MTLQATRLAFSVAAAALLLALALPTANAAQDIVRCVDPQFPIGPPVTAYFPEGSYWTPTGEYHVYGSTTSFQVWADNAGGVGAACVQSSRGSFDWCVNCITPVLA